MLPHRVHMLANTSSITGSHSGHSESSTRAVYATLYNNQSCVLGDIVQHIHIAAQSPEKTHELSSLKFWSDENDWIRVFRISQR